VDDRREQFEARILPHLDGAYSFARWLAGSAAEADDLLQDAILRAFRAFDAYRGEDAKAWLFAIVRNCHRSALRAGLRRPQAPLPEDGGAEALIEPAPGPEEQALLADERRLLDRIVSGLPEEQREILILREIEDMAYREIAQVLELPIGTVMSRLARARAALRETWVREIRGTPRAMR
jgi:RNA polymerase sigma-70 factor (ECF subfamily)